MNENNAGWMVLLAIGLLLLGIVLLAITGCGNQQTEEQYRNCVDSGGEWVQIGRNQWVCEHQKEGTE